MKYILLLALTLTLTNADTISNEKLHMLLQEDALKGKAKLPQRITKDITVADVKVEDSTQITTYVFDISDYLLEARALANKTKKEIVNGQMKDIMKKNFLVKACKSLHTPKNLLAMGAFYKSNFYSSDKVLQFSYTISKDDCK